MKLNLGCGKDIRKDCLNVDIRAMNGVDKVVDLAEFPYPFKDNQFDEIISYGVIELIPCDFLELMGELHRILKPNGILKIRCPAFPSTASVQDPLTQKMICWNSFDYFDPKSAYFYVNYRFKIIKRDYIFSLNPKLKWLSFIPNAMPKFYTKFLIGIFPSNNLYFELEKVK